MITEFEYEDFCGMMGFRMEKQEMLDALAMYGTPPEGVGKAEIFPNRPDMLSIEGISRALRGFIGIETGLKQYPVFQSGISVKVNDMSLSDIRPFCSFAVVDRVSLDDFSLASMMQLQEKLHMTHGRRRRKASIGIYDLGTVTPPLTYGALEPSRIEFVPLDSEGTMSAEQILSNHPKGREYRHLLEGLPKYPVLVDSKGRFLSMPPIINSDDTKVTPATTSIFIDATGWDQAAVDEAVKIMATSIAERFPKSRIGTVAVDGGVRVTPDMAPRTMSLDVGYCNRLLGVPLSSERIVECLKKMRFDAAIVPGGNNVSVAVPPYRTDIMHPIDLVEDVAIAHGYGNFSPSIPSMPNIGCELPESGISSALRTIMTGLGFTEAFTFALSNRKKLFENMVASPRKVAEIANPKTTDFTVVRDAILPGLLEVLGYNAHQAYPQKLFELGEVVSVLNYEARNGMAMAGVMAHSQANYSEIKSVVEAVCRMSGAICDIQVADQTLSAQEILSKGKAEIRYAVKTSDAPWFIRGRRASLKSDVGTCEFGEIHPQVLENWGIGVPVTAFELKFL